MFKFIGFYDYTVILTYTSLISAVFGMINSVNGRFGVAIMCLFISGICDAFDGKVARSKKNRTDDEKAFGIQIDSLCDCVSFGVFPALLCYCMGADGTLGIILAAVYSLCAVIRLAFFNVLEINRQKVEEGCNKTYRGLPITSTSIIIPITYCFHYVMPETAFVMLLHVVVCVTGFLFILDFSMPKFDFKKILVKFKILKED